MAKSKKKVSDKMIGVMIGIALTISAVVVISAVSVSYAHGRDASNMMDNGMMSGDMMPMMHSMMMNEQGDMSVEACRRMMSS